MFEQQLTGQEPERGPIRNQISKPVMTTGQKTFFVFLIVFALIVASFGVTYLIQYWKNRQIKTENPAAPVSTSTAAADDLAALLEKSRLANILPTSTAATAGNFASSSGQPEVEYLSFSNFYKAPDNKIAPQINDYKLPLDIKTDVLNYYDFSRKINIDKVVGDLDKNGFAIINNPFSGQDNPQTPNQKITDFYSVFDTLNTKQVPSLVTSDFLTYYYQNLTKKAFKDIEENVFYNNLWDLSSQMYDIAKDRYNQRLAEVGDINDPILEGARLEMAYFATALEILKPADDQVNSNKNNSDPSKFTVQESYDFSFNPASYLKVDVLEEVRLIREHGAQTKSPVLLYAQDYNDFTVPEDYKSDAKLNNFYLTTKWLNMAFPLYYQSGDCPSCSLDVDDWRVHTVAACFIAQDLFDNYNLKNEWARVYKILSYFKGLRADLTYVNYRDALTAVFGKDYNLKDLFSSSNPQMPDNFLKFQKQLAAFDFPAIEGALDKNDPANRSQFGAKMLSAFYWPNQYVFSRLTSPNVGAYKGAALKNTNVTGCNMNSLLARCMGFGLDIINLLSPVPATNSYFVENTNYSGYAAAVKNLQAEITSADWQENNFWTMLKTIGSSLAAPAADWPAFGRNAAWKDREIGRALGTWANLQTPLDTLGLYQKSSQVKNSASSDYYGEAYVEPNWQLINELLAASNMINGMFDTLQLNSAVQSMAISLSDLNQNLTALKDIIQKELTGETLSSDDYQFLDKFTKAYRVAQSGTKTFQLVGANGQSLKEDVSGVKLLIVVQKQGQDLILTAGPIFNYWETK